MEIPRRSRILSAVLLASLAAAGPGCSVAGLFYKEKYRSDRFVIYTDHDREFLDRVGSKVDEIYGGYGKLFGIAPGRLGRTSIFLEGDSRDMEVHDLAYSPSLLGYYVPLLNMISVDTKAPWTRERTMLDQILLHEVAHHFILTEFPGASKECWLNEGLAGNLEMTLFGGGRFEYPLLNPTLLGIARRAVLVDHPSARLRNLLSLGWSGFHDAATKDMNYALSWALVQFLLEEVLPPSASLHERILTLYRLDRSWIVAQEERFRDHLRAFDLTGTLIRFARMEPSGGAGPQTRCWALDQLGSLRFIDDARSLCFLQTMLDAPDRALAARVRLACLGILGRGIDVARRCSAFEDCRSRIAGAVLDPREPLADRLALAEAAGGLPAADPWWTPVLIRLLDAPEGELRVAAAAGLSRTVPKATIVNPSFWRDGPPEARRAEVDEWRAWWEERKEGRSSDLNR